MKTKQNNVCVCVFPAVENAENAENMYVRSKVDSVGNLEGVEKWRKSRVLDLGTRQNSACVFLAVFNAENADNM